MSWLLTALVVLSVWHFAWEMILLPTVRMRYRDKLFALRDELRRLRFEDKADLSDDVFEALEDKLNYFTNNLHRLTLSSRAAMRAPLSEEEAKELDDESARIMKCGVARVPEMYEEMAVSLDRVLLFNAGGWFIYVIPVAYAWYCYASTKKLVYNLVMKPKAAMAAVLELQPA